MTFGIPQRRPKKLIIFAQVHSAARRSVGVKSALLHGHFGSYGNFAIVAIKQT